MPRFSPNLEAHNFYYISILIRVIGAVKISHILASKYDIFIVYNIWPGSVSKAGSGFFSFFLFPFLLFISFFHTSLILIIHFTFYASLLVVPSLISKCLRFIET